MPSPGHPRVQRAEKKSFASLNTRGNQSQITNYQLPNYMKAIIMTMLTLIFGMTALSVDAQKPQTKQEISGEIKTSGALTVKIY